MFISSASLSYFFPFPVAHVIPLSLVRDSSSRLESVPTVGQSLALPGAKGIAHQGERDGHSEGLDVGRGSEVRLFSRTWKRK